MIKLMKWIIIGGLYITMAIVMVVYNGWGTAFLLTGVMFAPVFFFGILPYLLGSRPCGGSGEKGYFFSYKYKYGAKPPKL